MGVRWFSQVDYQGEPLERPIFHDSPSEIPPFLGSLPSFTSDDTQFILYSEKVREAVNKTKHAAGCCLYQRKDSGDTTPLESVQPHSIQLPVRSEAKLLPSPAHSISHFETDRQAKSERLFSRIPFSVGRKDVSDTEPLVLTSVQLNKEKKGNPWYTYFLNVSSKK